MNWMIAQMPFPDDEYEAKTDYALPANIEDQIYYSGIEKSILKDLGIGKEIYLETTKLLEVGTGFGGFIMNTALFGAGQYFGIEPDAKCFEFAKTRSDKLNLENIFLYNLHIEEMSFDFEKFDFICMFQILEHTKNPEKTLSKVYDTLKSNGKLIVATPNVEGYFAKKSLEKWRHTGPNHFWAPGKSTLISLLRSCNYEVEKYFTYSGFPAPRNIFGEIGNRLLKLFNMGDAIAVLCKK